MEYTRLRYAVEGGVARLTLQGSAGNRIDARCLDELEDAVARLREDPGAIVLLVTAAGDDFCTGWDDDFFATLVGAAPDRAWLDPFGVLSRLPLPVVAAVQGRAESAGLELALACDVRIAAATARFALPEVGLGYLPFAGGTQRLPRIAGRATALSMLLTGTVLDAEEALHCGLVSRVVPLETLTETAESLARTIASRGPVALRYAKEAVQAGSELSLDRGLRLEADLSVLLQSTRDRAEGVRGFIEKRPTRFEGR